MRYVKPAIRSLTQDSVSVIKQGTYGAQKSLVYRISQAKDIKRVHASDSRWFRDLRVGS